MRDYGPHSNGELDATRLNAGERASGWLLSGLLSPHCRVVCAPNLDGQPPACWQF